MRRNHGDRRHHTNHTDDPSASSEGAPVAGCFSQPLNVRLVETDAFSKKLVCRLGIHQVLPVAGHEMAAAVDVPRWLTWRGVPLQERGPVEAQAVKTNATPTAIMYFMITPKFSFEMVVEFVETTAGGPAISSGKACDQRFHVQCN